MTHTQALAHAATRALTTSASQYVVQTDGEFIVATDLDMTVRYAGERIVSVTRPDGNTRHL